MDPPQMPEIISEFLPLESKDLQMNEIDCKICGPALAFKLEEAKHNLYQQKWSLCKSNCQLLLDITWEFLNTGHWKDVNYTWRYIYSYACLFKAICEYAKNPSDYSLAIKTCDMGLLMGAPVLDNVLTKLVAKLNKLHKPLQVSSEESSTEVSANTACTHEDVEEGATKRRKTGENCLGYPQVSSDSEITSISCPSVEYFRLNHMESAWPVVLKDCMSYWPAMKKWNLNYIKSIAGLRTVPVEIGERYTDDAWSQKLMRIDEFITKYMEIPSEAAKGYLAQHPLFDQIPELQNDISIPTYCCLGESEDVDINAWFGPKGTVSPLHQDPKHNFLAQIVGEKYIKLYSVDQTELVYPHTEGLLTNTSQVDVENPDLKKFPKFKTAKPLVCILRPGDMLYIPPKCWHYVRSLSVSFSVSFWWE